LGAARQHLFPERDDLIFRKVDVRKRPKEALQELCARNRLESFELAGEIERLKSAVNGSIKRLPLRYDMQ